ncbi:MAG: hypothetical protein ACKV2T_07200 [Kofleriaceae bacterium]
MLRAAFLALTSCSFIPVSTAGPSKDSEVVHAEQGPPPSADKVPADAPKTLTAPDAAAPAIVESKGPFTMSGSHVGGVNVFLPVSREPANPWSGVSKGHPVKLDIVFEHWWIRDESLSCTAAVDHCLPAAAWFWVKNVVETTTLKTAYPVVFTTDGPKRPAPRADGNKPAFTAYRSVPATKKNLVVGARVFAFPDQPLPSGTDGVYDRWQMGLVDRVDWDLGMLFFKERDQPYFITAARVAVLSYEPDAGVKILDGKKRDELAVKSADLVLP